MDQNDQESASEAQGEAATCFSCKKTTVRESDSSLPGAWFFDDEVSDPEGHEAAFCSEKCRRAVLPDPILKAGSFLVGLDAWRNQGLPAGDGLRWAAASGHLHALLEMVASYRNALEEIADRDEGSDVNDNRFAGDVLKENWS